MNNLIVNWIGPVADRIRKLERAVYRFGVGHTYKVMLKRMKKSLEEPITIWNVQEVLVCIYMDNLLTFDFPFYFIPLLMLH